RGAATVLVGVVHRRQLEPVGVGTGQRHADEARRVPDHEGQQLGRRLLGREDQVALVLPVLVVDDDDRLAPRDLDGPLLHRPEGHDRATSFSTYLAITSTSRLTGSPTALRPSVVSLRVVGIRPTEKLSAPTAATVSETPSTAIEPFSTTYRPRPGGRVNRTVS